MSSHKFTNRAKTIIENAISEAQSNNNNMVEPEHLLKAILMDQSSVLNVILNPTEKEEMKNLILKKINNFARMPNCPTPDFGYLTASVLNKAGSHKDEYISVYAILLEIFELPSIKALIKNSDDIIKKIKAYRGDKKMDNPNADDTENPIMKFAVEMVEQARRNVFDPVIGRENEIREVIEILSKKTKSNAILVGKPGVGKTAIVTGLAQKIASGEAPGLKNTKIYNVDVGSIVAGACHRGDFEQRLKDLIKEAEETPGVILFIDEIHIVLGAGKTSDSAMDAANMLKPGLANGTIKCIGATTEDEYRQYVEKDPAFERRFVQVAVREPSIEDSITMLRGIRERLELHHGVKIADSALVYAAKASKQYIPNRRLPDIAIDLVDSACASAVISLEGEPQEIQEAKNKIWSLELEKTSLELDLNRGNDDVILKQIAEVDAKIKQISESMKPMEESYKTEKKHVIEAKILRKKLEDTRLRLQQAERDRETYIALDLKNNVIPVLENELKKLSGLEIITPNHVAEKISNWTGIPVKRLAMKDNERLLQMSNRIKKRIYGQDEAVDSIVNAILQSRVGIARKDKPIGAFLLLGPTGVGKTELAKAVSMELFDDEKNMLVLDMSDYGNEIAITKLIGASAGYVGYNEGGALTEPIRRKPYNVILLDEVDLAHQSVLNVLYQLLDEGRITDGKGVAVDFRNCVIIMTSNLGQEIIMNSETIGQKEKDELEKRVLEKFGPPFVNRIDNVIYFNQLDLQSLSLILNYQIEDLNKRLEDKNIKLMISEGVADDMICKSHSSVYGGRLLKRLVQKHFGQALTEIILKRTNENFMVVRCFTTYENQEGEKIGEYVYQIEN
uniref:ATP-dependent Clp protease heat shock protein 101 n=1 Tax=Nosema pernyi TaxID=1112939 RepID=A0A0N6W8D6_9MICR|nr:ATP-dependent Clp protease heat shock protein 101 [Nosema pernyi]